MIINRRLGLKSRLYRYCSLVVLFGFGILTLILFILKCKSPSFYINNSLLDESTIIFGCNPCITTLDKHSYHKLFELNPNEKNIPQIDIVMTWAGLNMYDDRNQTVANKKENMNPRLRNDNYDIRYCLRSIYQNIPWFHHIYLVVNNQTFNEIMFTNKTFINAKNPIFLKKNKITIINLVQLFCSKYINQCSALNKNTNSDSIETVLHRIPNLSNYYIYFNDDFMIGKQLHWTFFFGRNRNDLLIPRMPYILYKTYSLNAESWYLDIWHLLYYGYEKYKQESNIFSSTYECVENVINEEFKIDDIPYSNIDSRMRHHFDHMPRPYIKQHWIYFEQEYPKWFRFVRSHKKRFDSCNPKKIGNEESLPLHYLKRMITDSKRYHMDIDLLFYPIYDVLYFELIIQWIADFSIERNYYHYWIFASHVRNIDLLRYNLNQITILKPPTFSINDGGQKWENNQLIQQFYKQYFPNLSPIERRNS
eukprot:398173_1